MGCESVGLFVGKRALRVRVAEDYAISDPWMPGKWAAG